MFDKKGRFLKKALHTLPKLQKKELIELCKNLIHERGFFLKIIENNSQSVIVFHNDLIIFQGTKIVELMKEIPNLHFSSKYIGLISTQDIHHRDRILNIEFIEDEENHFFYIKDLSDSYNFLTSQKVEDGLGALENLAAGIAHEIKNPLTAIDIHTQLLCREINKKKITVSNEILNYLDIVQKENARLLHILNDFMNMTRKIKPQLVFTEIKDIIYNMINVFEGEFREKNIQITTSIKQVPKIFTAPVSLQQALSDLIRNAIEALENVQNKQIHLSLSEDQTKNYLVIGIEDSGIGIPQNIKAKIFTPYFTTKNKGTGLGLTFVKKIIHELNGTILLKDSQLGGIACVIFLPISLGQKKLAVTQ